MVDRQFEILFSYHFKTLERLFEMAARVDEADYFAARDYGRGSLHNLLFHVLVADHLWRRGLQSGSRPAGLEREDYPDLNSLQALLAAENAAWADYLADRDNLDPKAVLTLQSNVAGELELPTWWYLQHVAFHGMQHFAEIAQRLTELGHSPGNIDFIYYSAEG